MIVLFHVISEILGVVYDIVSWQICFCFQPLHGFNSLKWGGVETMRRDQRVFLAIYFFGPRRSIFHPLSSLVIIIIISFSFSTPVPFFRCFMRYQLLFPESRTRAQFCSRKQIYNNCWRSSFPVAGLRDDWNGKGRTRSRRYSGKNLCVWESHCYFVIESRSDWFWTRRTSKIFETILTQRVDVFPSWRSQTDDPNPNATSVHWSYAEKRESSIF